MRRTLAKIMHRKAAKAFDQWVEVVEAANDLEGKMQKVMLRIKNIAVAGAWSRWREMVEEIAEQRVKVGRALGKMMHRVMGAAFETWWQNWQDAVMARRQAEEEKRALEARLKKAIIKMQKKGLMSAFERWDEMTPVSYTHLTLPTILLV